MDLWDRVTRLTASAPKQLDSSFTDSEMQRLTALRERLALQPAHVDFELDARRLEFARWLFDQGRLSDFY